MPTRSQATSLRSHALNDLLDALEEPLDESARSEILAELQERGYRTAGLPRLSTGAAQVAAPLAPGPPSGWITGAQACLLLTGALGLVASMFLAFALRSETTYAPLLVVAVLLPSIGFLVFGAWSVIAPESALPPGTALYGLAFIASEVVALLTTGFKPPEEVGRLILGTLALGTCVLGSKQALRNAVASEEDSASDSPDPCT